jgi:hypothetical protein
LVDPYFNNINLRPASAVTYAKDRIKQKLKNNSRNITPMSFITGTAKDFEEVKKT